MHYYLFLAMKKPFLLLFSLMLIFSILSAGCTRKFIPVPGHSCSHGHGHHIPAGTTCSNAELFPCPRSNPNRATV